METRHTSRTTAMRDRKRDDDTPPGNPAWFDDLLQYSDRPVSRKLLIGISIGLAVAFIAFGATLLLFKPVNSVRPIAVSLVQLPA